MKKEKAAKKPDVLRVTLRLGLIALMFVGAALVYNYAGSEISVYEKIVIYALLAGIVAVAVQLCVWGFRWVKNERVSELGLHIVRFAVILTAVTLSVFVMMSADYTTQYNDSVKNELRQQALAGRIEVQELIGEELGTTGAYYDALYGKLPSLLDSAAFNANRHINLYLFVEPSKQPPVLGFGAMEADGGIFAASTDDRLGVTASAEFIASVYTSGEMAFSDYARADAKLRSAFVPVFTEAGRPVGVLEVCEPAQSSAALFGFTAIDLLLRVAALIALFSFGFYGVMQLVDIALRPKNVDRSRRVLKCGREAARPVLFFVSLSSALPVMLLMFSGEARGLIDLPLLPEDAAALLPALLYALCFLVGTLLARKVKDKLTEMPSNLSLAVAAGCALLMLLINNTHTLDSVPVVREWYVVLALVAVCGVCCGVSYRTIRKYQAQSDLLFGKDKYVYLCTALGAVTGVILGAWLLDASGEAGVKIAMLTVNIMSCVISTWVLEDLTNTTDSETRYDSRIRSVAGLMAMVVPLGVALAFSWFYLTGYLLKNGYSVTALSVFVCAPVVSFCFGNRLRLSKPSSQRACIAAAAVLAGLSYLPMVWTASPVMAVASCAILCLAVIFASAGIYSSLLPGERGRAAAGLLPAAAIGAVLCALLPSLPSPRVYIFVAAVATAVLGLIVLVSRYPERIAGANMRTAITGETEAPETVSFAPPAPVVPEIDDGTGSSIDEQLYGMSNLFGVEDAPEEPVEEKSYDWSHENEDDTALEEFPEPEEVQPADVFGAAEPESEPASEPESVSAFDDAPKAEAPEPDEPVEEQELPIVFPDGGEGGEGGEASEAEQNPFKSEEGSMDFGF